jgi:hypothetical protein
MVPEVERLRICAAFGLLKTGASSVCRTPSRSRAKKPPGRLRNNSILAQNLGALYRGTTGVVPCSKHKRPSAWRAPLGSGSAAQPTRRPQRSTGPASFESRLVGRDNPVAGFPVAVFVELQPCKQPALGVHGSRQSLADLAAQRAEWAQFLPWERRAWPAAGSACRADTAPRHPGQTCTRPVRRSAPAPAPCAESPTGWSPFSSLRTASDTTRRKVDFAEDSDGRLDGTHFLVDAVDRRVHQPQQPVSERSIAPHQFAHLPDVDGIVIQLAHNFEVSPPIGGNLALLQEDWVAEVVALKQGEAHRAGLAMVLVGLHLLRHHHHRIRSRLRDLLLLASRKRAKSRRT